MWICSFIEQHGMANWGPDGNLPLQQDKLCSIEVPANCRAEFQFSCESWYENAIIIYANNPLDPQVYSARGNYARTLSDWIAPITPQSATYLVTGWHKNGPPQHDMQWEQSPLVIKSRSDTYIEVGFEDGSDYDYNDILLTVSIRPR